MAAAQYIGIGGVARKVKSQFVGIGGVARKVKNGFVGVNGVARKCFGGETVTISGTGASWGRTIPAGAVVSGSVTLDVTFEIKSGSFTDYCNFYKQIQFSQISLPHSVSCDIGCFDVSSAELEYGTEGEITISETGISAAFHVEFAYGEYYNRINNASLADLEFESIHWQLTYTA